MVLHKDSILDLLETNLHEYLTIDKYEREFIDPENLLTHNRFDLGFKILYLDLLSKNEEFAKKIYFKHIQAGSLRGFSEPGYIDKNNFNDFLNSFNKTFNDISKNGFDNSKSLIPISKKSNLLNGSHRAACAIYLKKKLECLRIDAPEEIQDYKFFYKRNVPIKLLDIAALKFLEYANNIYLAFIWPIAKGNDKLIEENIPNIIYRKEIKLNANGAHNLISQIYLGEKWIGSIENNFKGAQFKLSECFKNFDPLRVIAFKSESLEKTNKIKDKIRSIFKIGKNSIHITDTKEETLKLANLVFNNNSIHFLNLAKPNKYISTYEKIKKFQNFINLNQLKEDDILIDSSLVLSCYGLREAKDVDYLYSGDFKFKFNFNEISAHDEDLKYHKVSKKELIYNPKYFFYYNNLKFISLDQLYRMKINRAEEKDLRDCALMQKLIVKSEHNFSLDKFKQNFFYYKTIVRYRCIKLLKMIGVYKVLWKLFKTLKLI